MNALNEQIELELKEARRRLFMKRAFEVLGWLTAVALFAFASHSVFAVQQGRRTQTPVVLASFAGQDRSDTQESSTSERTSRERKTLEREEISPASIMRNARTIYIAPTEYLDKTYLEYKLHKTRELDEWGLMLVADPRAADLIVTIDKTALNYIFNITDTRTTVILTSGKCIAVNGLVAAEYLGKEIIKKIGNVRASDSNHKSHKKKKSSRERDHDADDEDDDSSES
jgi:hypothetical protein